MLPCGIPAVSIWNESRTRTLTYIEGLLGLHGGHASGNDAPAEDEESQPCGRSNLCNDQIARHLEYQVAQGEDTYSRASILSVHPI